MPNFNLEKGDINFEHHSKFVSNHPYRKWFLINDQIRFVGSIYVTYENTIGINIMQNE